VDRFGAAPESNGTAATDPDGAGEARDGESSETPHQEDADHEPPGVD
jgi:hypothetical protein